MSRPRVYASNAAKQLAYRQRKDRNRLAAIPQRQIGNCTLYCGDAYTIVPLLPRTDYVLTDPPWQHAGQALELRGRDWRATAQKSTTLAKNAVGPWRQDAVTLCEAACTSDAFFIVGYREVGDVIAKVRHYRGTFVWHKPNSALAVRYPAKIDVAFIVWSAPQTSLYGHQHWPSMVLRHAVPNVGGGPDGRYLDATGKAVHPCQGPLSLYVQLLQPLPPGVCLDPFMGTGTCGVACVELGHTFIGIERDPAYFALACDRIGKAVAQGQLFTPAVQAQQGALF